MEREGPQRMTGGRMPGYVRLAADGTLRARAKAAREILRACTLCPRRCRANRLAGEFGFCRTGERAVVASFGPHFGEESPLVGTRGSGTIFFSNCNLGCNFCQNFDISHRGRGEAASAEQLAGAMLSLQGDGCHNINLVTPSHVLPQFLAALDIAAREGLRIPLVFNTGAYDRVAHLELLEGVVDIYMPDFKFWNPEVSRATCGVWDYPETARSAIREMHRQVGDLAIDERGLAVRGLLLRHLVMPGGLSGTRDIMRFICRSISPDTYVNIMPQYRPCGEARSIEAMASPLSNSEFKRALMDAEMEGIRRLDRRRRRFFIC